MNKHTGLFLTAIVAIVALVSIVMMSGPSADVALLEEDLVGMAPASVWDGSASSGKMTPEQIKEYNKNVDQYNEEIGLGDGNEEGKGPNALKKMIKIATDGDGDDADGSDDEDGDDDDDSSDSGTTPTGGDSKE